MQRRNPPQQQPPPPSQQLFTTETSYSNTVISKHQQHHPATAAILSSQAAKRSTLSKTHAPTSFNSSSGTSNNGVSHYRRSDGGILRIWVLLLIILVLTLIISLFPEPRQIMYNTEQQMEKVIYETEQELERDVMEYWLSSKRFYTGDTTGSSVTSNTHTMYESDVRMQQQSSKWVDDEKKLKQALQVLVDRQTRGLDLGVPVLTRYLGEHIPAFYSKDDPSLNLGIASVEEWNRLIQEKYTEMRNEENRWREIVTKTLLSDRG